MTERLSLFDVRARLLAERGHGGDSWPWTLKFLERADLQFGGEWHVTSIDGRAAGDIVLPAHAGEPCRGDQMALVPDRGATVREASDRLREIEHAYAAANPTCWRRLMLAARQPFSTIAVTMLPLTTREHAGLAPVSGRLYHLDGFHRLLGWALAGRLDRTASIPVIVAGSRLGPVTPRRPS